jgi:uncharacterized protein
MQSIEARIATELTVGVRQVEAAVRLLDAGATVPFVARYRKEATGGLDDTQLRQLDKRLSALRDLEDRRASILKSLTELGQLTPRLEQAIGGAETQTQLEDLYRPFRPKRRTKAQIAREAGLAPLAAGLLANPNQVPERAAHPFVDAARGVPDVAAALDGAQQIIIEEVGDAAEVVGRLREHLWDRADLISRVVRGKQQEGAKFSDYFDAAEALRRVPSHRALAMLRGREASILRLSLALKEDAELAAGAPGAGERLIAAHLRVRRQGRPADAWLADTVHAAWRKLAATLETDLLHRLRERAETEAIEVFARNLRDILLAAPAGRRVTMGLDPGLRTGVKVAVVDATGKLLATETIYPHAPRNDWDASIATLARLAAAHRVELLSIGNGTASRETDRLAAALIARHPELSLTRVLVSEAGASVYSASELAAAEFPQLDVALRGAVSIARRLQDPLAELVKIDAKAIGVGQYQHDVDQSALARALDGVVEDAVNAVGVEVNTASAALLTRVSGLGTALAGAIVRHRDAHGPFRHRRQLLDVPRLGARAFEQAAGFLRIADGDDPLDASGVHPEAYPVVERILARVGRDIRQLIGDSALLRSLAPAELADARFGEPTVRDILAELDKPGRDPRPQFRSARFRDGIEHIEQLQPGMQLEGVVTNVTNFGAFVDVGVHQDGLVHISALADSFVRDPHAIVKAGDVVSVRVVSVDLARRRIALSMRRAAS